jgi:ABC-2 type transport system permease protein
VDFIVGSSLFKFLIAAIRTVVMLLFGIVALGYWQNPDPVSLLLVLIPASVAVFALGLLFSAFVVLIKQADPIISAYSLMAAVLGGVLFPVQALPIWIKPLAWLIPLSHALTGLRLALHGSPPSELWPQIISLAVLSAVLLPASIFSFRWALERAKKDGTLIQY